MGVVCDKGMERVLVKDVVQNRGLQDDLYWQNLDDTETTVMETVS